MAKFSESHIPVIERCAGLGLTLKQISYIVGVSDRSLKNWMDKPGVREAYDRGRAIATEKVAQKLFDKVLSGDSASIFFWLKCQAGWREKDKLDETQSSSSVVFYLPSKDKV